MLIKPFVTVTVTVATRVGSQVGAGGGGTPRKNFCACVNLTCNSVIVQPNLVATHSIANLMRICSERFRRLKMAVKRSDFIVRLYSQISSAKIYSRMRVRTITCARRTRRKNIFSTEIDRIDLYSVIIRHTFYPTWNIMA